MFINFEKLAALDAQGLQLKLQEIAEAYELAKKQGNKHKADHYNSLWLKVKSMLLHAKKGEPNVNS
jgi:hypothetical protein